VNRPPGVTVRAPFPQAALPSPVPPRNPGLLAPALAPGPDPSENAGVVTLATPRLLLRRWSEEDAAPLAAVNADPEVMRWIGDGAVRTPRETRSGIAQMEREWEERGFGLFAVELRATGELAGFTGLSVPLFLPELLPAVEIGWRLGRDHWGRGLATEAAAAVLRYGFRERGLDRIVAVSQVGNDASERVIAKLGLGLFRETADPRCGRALRVHELTAGRYTAAAG
jgi:RimJ/RimL family protein N-acetyltransferase